MYSSNWAGDVRSATAEFLVAGVTYGGRGAGVWASEGAVSCWRFLEAPRSAERLQRPIWVRHTRGVQ